MFLILKLDYMNLEKRKENTVDCCCWQTKGCTHTKQFTLFLTMVAFMFLHAS